MPYKDKAKQKEAQRKYDAKRAGKRHTSWTAAVYPDSAPDNWLDILSEQLLKAIVSPLHDSDIEHDGTQKKPHYHVIISFPNAVSYDDAKEIFEEFNAVVPPERKCWVRDFRGACRYLCHLDQPNKQLYDESKVITFGGIDYQDIIMSASELDVLIDDMCDFIDENCIVSYYDFCRYVRKNKPEWKHAVYHNCSYIIREYIKGFAWKIENKSKIDYMVKMQEMQDQET